MVIQVCFCFFPVEPLRKGVTVVLVHHMWRKHIARMWRKHIARKGPRGRGEAELQSQ